MEKRKFLTLLVSMSLILVLVVAACKASPTPSPAPAPTVTVTATPAPAKAITLKALRYTFWDSSSLFPYREFIKRINEQSEGRLVIKDLGGTEVYPPAEQLKMVKLGTVDILDTIAGYLLSDYPEINISSAAFGTVPADMRAAGAAALFDKISREKHGLVYLGDVSHLRGNIWLTKKTIKTLADLKSLKIRASGDWLPVLTELTTPAIIAFPEVYSALTSGVVDGMGWPEYQLTDQGFQDVVKYRVDPPFWKGGGQPIFINLKTFNSLPKDLQDLLVKTVIDIEKWEVPIRDNLAKAETKLLAQIGIKSITLTDQEWLKTQEIQWQKGVVEQAKGSTYADELVNVASKFYPPKREAFTPHPLPAYTP